MLKQSISAYLYDDDNSDSEARVRMARDGLNLFSSSISGSKVEENLARTTLATIQTRAAPGIRFYGKGMLPWKPLGSSSAQTLDLIDYHILLIRIDQI